MSAIFDDWEDVPRAPAGSSEGGQWTSGSHTTKVKGEEDYAKIEEQYGMTKDLDEHMAEAKKAAPEITEFAEMITSKFKAAVDTGINFKSRSSLTRKAKDEYNFNVKAVSYAVRTTLVVYEESETDKIK